MLILSAACSSVKPQSTPPVSNAIENPAPADEVEYVDPLENIWRNESKFEYSGYVFEHNCKAISQDTDCSLTISKNGKKLFDEYYSYTREEWQRIGFLKVLNTKNDQAIIQLYSGGAHCCLDYVIYDLEPKFRAVYDSRKYGPDMIGGELTPVDIDGDGILEFHRDVMAFDYMSPFGHAGAAFPPAVFRYEESSGKFELANTTFSKFILSLLDKRLNLYKKSGWHEKTGEMSENSTRNTFLFLVYAGKKDEAWKYFDENYTFPNREKYRKDFIKLFQEDRTYKSIYGTK